MARIPHHILTATGIREWVPALIAVVAVVGGVRAAVRTPFTLARALADGPHLSAAVRRWLRSELTAVVATVVVGTVASVPLYALLRATPAWWFPAWLLFAAVTVGWQLLMPVAVNARA
ncbi:MAG: hypothetical protein M3326_10995, partial [Actinomycetota bacterium]|nr:hypothetical protein [Actinomycetota bacterium]